MVWIQGSKGITSHIPSLKGFVGEMRIPSSSFGWDMWGNYPPPRMQSSPPGWHSIFSRESQPKPSFVTVTGWGVDLMWLVFWEFFLGRLLFLAFFHGWKIFVAHLSPDRPPFSTSMLEERVGTNKTQDHIWYLDVSDVKGNSFTQALSVISQSSRDVFFTENFFPEFFQQDWLIHQNLERSTVSACSWDGSLNLWKKDISEGLNSSETWRCFF